MSQLRFPRPKNSVPGEALPTGQAARGPSLNRAMLPIVPLSAKILLFSATITLVFHFLPQKGGTQPAPALRIAINPGKYSAASQLVTIVFKTWVCTD